MYYGGSSSDLITKDLFLKISCLQYRGQTEIEYLKLHFKIVKTAYDDGYIMFHQIIQSTKECVNPLETTVKIAGNLTHFNIFYVYILIYY